MHDALLDALKGARSIERVAEAIEAGTQAAYVNTPQHGVAAAIDVLARKDEEAAPADGTAEATTDVTTETTPATE